MSRRVIRLVEWRTRELILPRADVDFLLSHARTVFEVQPAFGSGKVRLTARGAVGFLDGPTIRFVIRPKVPWPNLLMLLGLERVTPAPGQQVEADAALLSVLAHELAGRIRAVVQSGLVRGYREADTVSAFLRGRLRTADQVRDAAARAFPDHFHVTESVFDLDTPWNRIPKGVATALLARTRLPGSVRADLAAAVGQLDTVPHREPTDADFDAAEREPRAAGYRDVLDLCRLIRDGFRAARLGADGAGGFLLDLGRVFEQHLARGVADALASRPAWSVEAQPRFVLAATRGETAVLQPDLVLRRRGQVLSVLDAKWKRPGLDAADLHQVLAYAAVTGARHVGLVYPGSRTARRQLHLPGGRVRVSLLRLRVVGPPEACRDSVTHLVRMMCRSSAK